MYRIMKVSVATSSTSHLPIAPISSVHPKTPSSSTSGFFQTPPRLENQFHDDRVLRRVLDLHIHKTLSKSPLPDLAIFGENILKPQVFSWIADAERNPPYLRTWDVWGKRRDELVTSEGWRNLQALGIREGIVAIAYERQWGLYARLYQMLKYHLWSGSSAYVICPSAMTDGAARLLAREVLREQTDERSKRVFENAYKHMVSRDPDFAWTSGQWMTERVGGSDVRNTETQATPVSSSPSSSTLNTTDTEGSPLGPWSITGFKWFSSATDANMAILLARDPTGSISAFYAPLRRSITTNSSTTPTSRATPATTEPNGVQIQRLKTKLGTRPLPTAELVLSNTRAYLLGEQGHGTREISTILNITRVHNAVTAVGLWGRALAISRAFSRVRRVSGGKLLMDVPAHVRQLAEITVEYAGMMHLTYFIVLLLGASEYAEATPKNDSSNNNESTESSFPELLAGLEDPVRIAQLLRLLTPITKAVTALASIASLSALLESLGGVGYVDDPADPETNIARLLRDAQVLSIWEGTTDVMAADMVRVLKGRDGRAAMQALANWVHRRTNGWKEGAVSGEADAGIKGLMESARNKVRSALEDIQFAVEKLDAEQLKYQGRELMSSLSWLVSAVILIEDARRDGDAGMAELAHRWLRKKSKRVLDSAVGLNVSENHTWDRRIVFGDRFGIEGVASKL